MNEKMAIDFSNMITVSVLSLHRNGGMSAKEIYEFGNYKSMKGFKVSYIQEIIKSFHDYCKDRECPHKAEFVDDCKRCIKKISC